jgi:N-acetylmuramoyl-L-alanine amidase
MSKLSILIDPGHSPIHPGTEAKDGTPEYDLNLLQAKIVKAELDKANIPTEIFDPDSDPLDLIGQKAADDSMFLSLHHNAYDKKPHYTCVMVHPTKAKPQSIAFATKLSTAVANAIGQEDFGVMRYSVTVLSESEDTNCPICVLCESYFLDAIDTRAEAEQLSTKAAYAIASAVITELQQVSHLRINNPTNNAKFESKSPVTFSGEADPEIITINLRADDQYDLGSNHVDSSGSWSITYPGFSEEGDRKITAIGFNSVNQPQAETSINITILPNGIKFPPVPSEDRANGRNDNCYNPGFPLTEAMKQRFVEDIKPICIEMERKYGVPAAFLGGQAVHESGFGLTRIGYFANNFCGLKFLSAWERKPPQIMNGQDFGVETYQLIGQTNEEKDDSVKVLVNLGENRLIFDEESRYDNRYFKFKSKSEFFDFLCRIAYLNASQTRLYPEDLRDIFTEYQQKIQKGESIREACSLVAQRLGERGYCSTEDEGDGDAAERRGRYYRRVVTEAMDQWNTYDWTEIALNQNQ